MTNSTDLKVVGGLLALALALGGAGISFPRLQMALQLCALAAAAYFIATRRSWRFPRLSYVALGLIAAVLLLPLLQLVPLPPSIWTGLSGREMPAELDATLGLSQWRPLTLDVEGTVRSFVTLLPAVVVFAGALFLPRTERVQLLWVVLAFAIISAILGIAQLASGGWFTPYPSGHRGYPLGLFVNRNHNAALLLVALPVTAALGVSRLADGRSRTPWIVAALSAMIIFTIVIVGTTSRMGLILLPLALAASLALLFHRQAAARLVWASLIIVGALASLFLATGRLDRTLSRFSGFDDARFDYWTDIQWALGYYGFAGTGFGTFMPVYKSAESLEAVVPQVTNHAHNDYLEILLEGGLPAVLLFLLFLIVIAIALARSFSGGSRGKSPARPGQSAATGAAALGIAILLAASIVDYPLRMPALSAVFAVFCALLLPSKTRAVSTTTDLAVATSRSSRTWIIRWFGLAVLGALVVLVLQAGISGNHLASRHNAAALQWAGWSTEAHERLATDAVLRNDVASAISHGRAAILLSPISAPAIRSLGLARLTQGPVTQGNRLMQVAVGLGWRDPLTQLWAIEAAKTSGEPEKAVQRAEALFRQDVLVAAAITQLLDSPGDHRTVPLLARGLAQQPAWRGAFFKASGDVPPAAAAVWLKLVAMLKRSSAPVSLSEGEPMLNALVLAGRFEYGQRLWEMLRPGDGLVINGGFETIDPRRGATFPTYWYVPTRNRALVRVENPHSGSTDRALHIRSTEDPTILRQVLMLRPGAYRLSYRVRAMVAPGPALQWELRCDSSGARQSTHAEILPGANWQEIGATLTVPVQNCPIQRLALKSSGATPIENVWLDEIRLERVSR